MVKMNLNILCNPHSKISSLESLHDLSRSLPDREVPNNIDIIIGIERQDKFGKRLFDPAGKTRLDPSYFQRTGETPVVFDIYTPKLILNKNGSEQYVLSYPLLWIPLMGREEMSIRLDGTIANGVSDSVLQPRQVAYAEYVRDCIFLATIRTIGSQFNMAEIRLWSSREGMPNESQTFQWPEKELAAAIFGDKIVFGEYEPDLSTTEKILLRCQEQADNKKPLSMRMPPLCLEKILERKAMGLLPQLQA